MENLDNNNRESITTIQQKNLLTISEVALYLNIRQKTIYAKVSAGEIPHYRIGRLIRFRIDEINAWLEDCKNQTNVEHQKIKSKRRKSSKQSTDHFSKIIRKTVDVETDKYYSVNHGKSDRIKGPKQEVEHGSI